MIPMADVAIGDWVTAETDEGEIVESQVSFVVELDDEDDLVVLDYDYVRTSDIVEVDGRDEPDE